MSGKKIQQTTRLSSTQEHCSTRAHLQKWVINLASKHLSPGKVKLLQRGPKFAVTSPRVPFTEYIAVTKQIYDRLGGNTDGVDCSEYYTKEEREATKTLKEDDACVVLTADKG